MLDEFFSLHFTTAGLPEADRLAHHREYLGAAMGVVDIEATGEAPFHGETRLAALPDFGLASIVTSPTRVTRNPGLMPQTDESVILVLMGKGSGAFRVTQGKHELDVPSSQAVLLRGTEPIHCANETVRLHTVRLPTASFAHLLADFDGAIGRTVPSDAPGLSLLTAYLDAIHDALPGSPALRHVARTHISDLMAVFLGATRDAEAEAMGRGVAAARLRAIKSDIAERLGQPDLAAEQVARRHAVSGRYVQMLFEKDGATFGTYLSGLRLAQAHRRLSDPAAAHLSITEIVFEAGFNELSTFYRAFRRRYGATHSDIRTAAQAADRKG